MDLQTEKCVMVLDERLQLGLVANTAAEADLSYFGVALCGPKKKVNKLTGNLPLLR